MVNGSGSSHVRVAWGRHQRAQCKVWAACSRRRPNQPRNEVRRVPRTLRSSRLGLPQTLRHTGSPHADMLPLARLHPGEVARAHFARPKCGIFMTHVHLRLALSLAEPRRHTGAAAAHIEGALSEAYLGLLIPANPMTCRCSAADSSHTRSVRLRRASPSGRQGRDLRPTEPFAGPKPTAGRHTLALPRVGLELADEVERIGDLPIAVQLHVVAPRA